MARNRELMKLADYVVIALNPALVMAMVGALVFFLVEVLYVGQYQGSLLYILSSRRVRSAFRTADSRS